MIDITSCKVEKSENLKTKSDAVKKGEDITFQHYLLSCDGQAVEVDVGSKMVDVDVSGDINQLDTPREVLNFFMVDDEKKQEGLGIKNMKELMEFIITEKRDRQLPEQP